MSSEPEPVDLPDAEPLDGASPVSAEPPEPESVDLPDPEPVDGASPASAEAAESVAVSETEPTDSEPTDAEPVDGASAVGTAEEAADDEAAEVVESTLPDVSGDDALECALEALLLVVDTPAEEELLADTLDQPVARIRATLERMSAALRDGDRGMDLRKVGAGWRYFTRDRYAPYVERMLLDGQRAKLTRAALETLAVIAYRQPVTRARVAAVRGVNVDGVIRTLLARGLVEETGQDPETQGLLYRTTELFLERLGLASLADLPPIAPLLPEVDSIDDV